MAAAATRGTERSAVYKLRGAVLFEQFRYSPSDQSMANTVGSILHSDPSRGIDRVIQVAPSLSKRSPPVDFIIVSDQIGGEASDNQKLRSTLERMATAGKCRVVFVPEGTIINESRYPHLCRIICSYKLEPAEAGENPILPSSTQLFLTACPPELLKDVQIDTEKSEPRPLSLVLNGLKMYTDEISRSTTWSRQVAEKLAKMPIDFSDVDPDRLWTLLNQIADSAIASKAVLEKMKKADLQGIEPVEVSRYWRHTLGQLLFRYIDHLAQIHDNAALTNLQTTLKKLLGENKKSNLATLLTHPESFSMKSATKTYRDLNAAITGALSLKEAASAAASSGGAAAASAAEEGRPRRGSLLGWLFSEEDATAAAGGRSRRGSILDGSKEAEADPAATPPGDAQAVARTPFSDVLTTANPLRPSRRGSLTGKSSGDVGEAAAASDSGKPDEPSR